MRPKKSQKANQPETTPNFWNLA